VVTVNGEAAFLLYSSPTQINLQIPSDIASGPALLNVYNGALNAYTLVVNIDTQPAAIAGIADNAGNPVGTSNPAVQGGLLTVSLSGFAPDNLTIDPSRVQVGVAGATHPAFTVTQSTPGIYQVSFLLAPDEAPGQNQSLIVYLDGRSSYPVAIPLTTPDGSFTVAVIATTAGS
jgi:uncharacterized protein (TIGR03437 family)